MCLSLPGKILSISKDDGFGMAVVDFGGVKRDICVEWVPEAKVGDYVLAHVGTALSCMDEKSALENIAALNELSDKIDLSELQAE